MTAEELKEIKDAAVRIHSAAVAAGKWENKPEWESKLMDIVCDISRAVIAGNTKIHGNLRDFEQWTTYVGSHVPPLTFRQGYDSFILGSVGEALADAVIDILDTVEGFYPEWYDEHGEILERKTDGYLAEYPDLSVFGFKFVQFLGTLDALLYDSPGSIPVIIIGVELIRRRCALHGIDLRRHVQLKMKYNEMRG